MISYFEEKAHASLVWLHNTTEAIYTTYDHITNSQFLEGARTLIADYAPLLGRSFIWLEKPCHYLKGGAVAGALACGLKLNKYRKEIKHNASPYLTLKICNVFAQLIDNGEKFAIALHKYKWTDWLAQKNLPLAAQLIKTIIAYKVAIGIFVWTLNLSQLFLDVAKLKKIQYQLENFTRTHDPKTLEKQFKVDGIWLSKNLPSDILLKNRLKTLIHLQKLVLLADTINLLATALIFTSVLHPAGYVFLASYLTLSLGCLAFRKITFHPPYSGLQ